MLQIIICEDNPKLLNLFALFIKQYLHAHQSADIKLVLATSNPNEIINHLAQHKNKHILYFLDIEFSNSITQGLDLAKTIRKQALNADIVFITSHNELAPITFERDLGQLDYIEKGRGLKQIKQLIFENIDKLTAQSGPQRTVDQFHYKIGSAIHSINKKNIVYFEAFSNSHKIIIHTLTARVEFRNTLNNIESQLPFFYRIHKSLLVNRNYVKSINSADYQIILTNGISLPVARRKIANLKQTFKAL